MDFCSIFMIARVIRRLSTYTRSSSISSFRSTLSANQTGTTNFRRASGSCPTFPLHISVPANIIFGAFYFPFSFQGILVFFSVIKMKNSKISLGFLGKKTQLKHHHFSCSKSKTGLQPVSIFKGMLKKGQLCYKKMCQETFKKGWIVKVGATQANFFKALGFSPKRFCLSVPQKHSTVCLVLFCCVYFWGEGECLTQVRRVGAHLLPSMPHFLIELLD